MESKLNDTGREFVKFLAMLKSRLLMKFQSSGHATPLFLAQSYASPSAKFKDMTNGIDFLRDGFHIEEHFDEEKERYQRVYH